MKIKALARAIGAEVLATSPLVRCVGPGDAGFQPFIWIAAMESWQLKQ